MSGMINSLLNFCCLVVIYSGLTLSEELDCGNKISEAINLCNQYSFNDEPPSTPEEKIKTCNALEESILCSRRALTVTCKPDASIDELTGSINKQIETRSQTFEQMCRDDPRANMNVECIENAVKAIGKCKSHLEEGEKGLEEKDEEKLCKSVPLMMTCVKGIKTEVSKCDNEGLSEVVQKLLQETKNKLEVLNCDKAVTEGGENGAKSSSFFMATLVFSVALILPLKLFPHFFVPL